MKNELEILEFDRLSKMNACLSQFALEGEKGLKSSLATFREIQNVCEKATFAADVAVATKHLNTLWPEIPMRSYEHPALGSGVPLSYLSFGVPIGFSCSQQKREIPLILTRLIEEIESRGLQKQGLYRTSGRVKDVCELRSCLERDLPNANISETDVPILCQVVKMYLRELPFPLFPFYQSERLEYSREFLFLIGRII
jgi:hypothetical protein